MTTVDPDGVEHEHAPREWRAPAVTTAAVWGLVVCGVVLLAAGAVFGWGMTRSAATGFADVGPEVDEPATVVTILSIFPFCAALAVWIWVASRHPRLPGWATAVGVTLVGATLGHVVTAPRPDLLQGPVLDVPAVVLGVAALALLAWGLTARSSRARRADAQDELVRANPSDTDRIVIRRRERPAPPEELAPPAG